MTDSVYVLGITPLALLAGLSATTNGGCCQRRLLCQGTSLLSAGVALANLGALVALLLILLLGCHLLLQEHHSVLLLVELVKLSTMSIHVEAVLDEVAVLVAFLDVLKLVLRVEDLLLLCFLVLLLSCSTRCFVDLWLSLIVFDVLFLFFIILLIFIVSYVSLLAFVLLPLDHHGVVVVHLDHLILVVICTVVALILIFILLLFLLLVVQLLAWHELEALDHVLVFCQELCYYLFWHWELVWVLLVLVVQVLKKDGFLVVLEASDVDELIFIVFAKVFSVVHVFIGIVVILLLLHHLASSMWLGLLLLTISDVLFASQDVLFFVLLSRVHLGIGFFWFLILAVFVQLLVHLLLHQLS